MPLNHPAGQAQADFGEALVLIGGVEQKAYFLPLIGCRVMPVISGLIPRPIPKRRWTGTLFQIAAIESNLQKGARFRRMFG